MGVCAGNEYGRGAGVKLLLSSDIESAIIQIDARLDKLASGIAMLRLQLVDIRDAMAAMDRRIDKLSDDIDDATLPY